MKINKDIAEFDISLQLAEMRRIEGTHWMWSRIIGTPTSLCTASYWTALASWNSTQLSIYKSHIMYRLLFYNICPFNVDKSQATSYCKENLHITNRTVVQSYNSIVSWNKTLYSINEGIFIVSHNVIHISLWATYPSKFPTNGCFHWHLWKFGMFYTI